MSRRVVRTAFLPTLLIGSLGVCGLGPVDVTVSNDTGSSTAPGAFLFGFIRGDVTGDGEIGLPDPLFGLDYFFANGPAPADTAVVVQHSFVLNQFSREAREEFYALLDELSAVRPIHRISTELLSHERGPILGHTLHGDVRRETELASVHYHGRWIQWFS